MTLSVQPIQSTDAKAAAQIHYLTWKDVFSQWIPIEICNQMTLEACERIWLQLTDSSSPLRHTVGIFQSGELIGTIVWGEPREDKAFEVELYSMLIHPSRLSQGAGQRLFAACLQNMREQGFKNFYLNCIDVNTRALRFYEKMGGRTLPGSVNRKGYRELRIHWTLNQTS